MIFYRVCIQEYFRSCPLLGGLSSFGVSFIGGFTVKDTLGPAYNPSEVENVFAVQDSEHLGPRRVSIIERVFFIGGNFHC